MSARIYFIKRVKDCKGVSIMSAQVEDGQVYSVCVYCKFLVLLSIYNSMQSKHKQTKCNIADETLTDYSFLSRYH